MNTKFGACQDEHSTGLGHSSDGRTNSKMCLLYHIFRLVDFVVLFKATKDSHSLAT